MASLVRIAAGTAYQVTVVTGYPALKDPAKPQLRFQEQGQLEVDVQTFVLRRLMSWPNDDLIVGGFRLTYDHVRLQ